MKKMIRIIQLFFCFFVFIDDVSIFAQVFHQWQEIGPFGGRISSVANDDFTGNGIIYCVETHPSDPNILYVGTPGGIWKSFDGGQNWESFATNKEFDHTISVGNILVDKNDPNVVYVSTGAKMRSRKLDYYGPDQVTSGLYRCLIGSNNSKSWTKISDGLPATDGYYDINRPRIMGYFITLIKQCPFDPNTLYVGTSFGLYKTTNINNPSPTWQLVSGVPQNKAVYSVQFTVNSTSGNYNCYVSGDDFALKTSDFSNWTNLIGNGIGQLNVGALVADLMTPLNPNDIEPTMVSRFLVVSTPSLKNGDKMYFGIMIVGDNGATSKYFFSHIFSQGWLQLCASNNNPSCHFKDERSQDISIACAYNVALSPFETIVMGFEYLHGLVETTMGEPFSYQYFLNSNGYSTSLFNKWSHADIRDLKLSQDKHYFYCPNDGMLSKFDPYCSLLTSVGCWQQMNNDNISLGRFWSLDCSDYVFGSDLIGVGSQDNGILFYSGLTGWKIAEKFGDGIGALIKNEELHLSAYGGYSIFKKRWGLNFGSYASYAGSYGHGPGYGWQFRQFYKDPLDKSITYLSQSKKLYKFVNGNVNNPNLICDLNTYQISSRFAVSPTDNNYMYYAFAADPTFPEHANLRITSNGTSANPSWQELSLPYDNAGVGQTDSDWIKGLVVSSINPKVVFIAFHGTIKNGVNNRARIYKSINGGQSWEDYNESEISIPNRYQIHSLLYEKGSNDGVYAGTDNGVYYTNKNLNSWIRYDLGLPNIPVMEMVYHPIDNKILIATWGRGVWVVPPYCAPYNDITINSANLLSYLNTPVNATNIYYNCPLPALNGPPSLEQYRHELKASNQIEFQPGVEFDASYYSSKTSLEAYITPCGTGYSTLRKKTDSKTGSKETERFNDFSLDSISHNELNQGALKENEIHLYPNPITNGEINLKLGKYYDQLIEVRVTDNKGVVLKSITNQVGLRELKVEFSPSPGIYLLNVLKNGVPVYTEKIIVPTTSEESNKE